MCPHPKRTLVQFGLGEFERTQFKIYQRRPRAIRTLNLPNSLTKNSLNENFSLNLNSSASDPPTSKTTAVSNRFVTRSISIGVRIGQVMLVQWIPKQLGAQYSYNSTQANSVCRIMDLVTKQSLTQGEKQRKLWYV